MLIPGAEPLLRVARRCRNTIVPGSLILLYHRIAEVREDPWSLCVTPRHFAEHLNILRSQGRPVQLQGLTQALEAKRRLPRSIAVTFDDGYADNLHNAKPLLERNDVAATVFVVSDHVGQEREFWWDELERLVLQSETLPESLYIQINGSDYRWQSGTPNSCGQNDKRPYSGGYSAPGASKFRLDLYHSLWKRMSPLRADDRCNVLDQLQKWSHAAPTSRRTHRILSVKELLTLNEGSMIEIGSHTKTHPYLSKLRIDLQRAEIQGSKTRLEQILGHPVSSFAYPHGDYTMDTTIMVAKAGFSCACSTVAESVRGDSDRFRLPRLVVQDWDGEEFARRLSRWFRA